jgi:hypothetical protein
MRTSRGKQQTTIPTCGQCGWEAESDSGWKTGEVVFHCEGGTGSERYRGEVHHLGFTPSSLTDPRFNMLHPLCWKCGSVVGCLKCAGIVKEALCLRCAVWVTKRAFVEHGAVLNTEEMLRKRHGLLAPQFDEYPEDFHRAYLKRWKQKPQPINPKTTFKQLVGVHLAG